MASINIQLPVMDAEHSIEIEVRINGNKTRYQYRVEIIQWDECPDPDDHARCLKEKIGKYDRKWKLIQIGGPTAKNIPVMFKQVSH